MDTQEPPIPERDENLPEPQPGGTNSYLGGGITQTQQEMSTYREPSGIGGVGGTFRDDPEAEPPGIAPTGTGVEGLSTQDDSEEPRSKNP